MADYHTHPPYSDRGFSFGDISSTFPKTNFISYVSHSGVGLFALDWSSYQGWSASQIYHYQEPREVTRGGK